MITVVTENLKKYVLHVLYEKKVIKTFPRFNSDHEKE
jgi:hypothetical protein